jgi:hypothetical protein
MFFLLLKLAPAEIGKTSTYVTGVGESPITVFLCKLDGGMEPIPTTSKICGLLYNSYSMLQHMQSQKLLIFGTVLRRGSMMKML